MLWKPVCEYPLTLKHDLKCFKYPSCCMFFQIIDHYQRIASGYDAHYEGLHKAVLPIILDKFNFAPSDVLLDLGSGTGTLALNTKKQARLEHPVICVEPCEEMVKVAKKIEGITVIQATAEDFTSQAISSYHFNKVLVAFCSHQFVDSREMVLTKLSECLPMGGVCLIIDRQQKTALPLFKAALERHQTSHANNLSSEQYSALVQPMGFEVSSSDISLEYSMTKLLWYETLRERYISCLHQLTDEQIEDGISELESHFQAQKDSEDIPVCDPVNVHKLVKKH